MRSHFLILLAIPLFFGCENRKEVLLSERFELFNLTLEAAISNSAAYNKNLYEKLNSGSQLRLETLRDNSKGVIDYLDNLKAVLIEKTGGFTETGMLIGINDFNTSYDFIRNSTYSMNFVDSVNSITNLITTLKLFDASPIVIDGRDDPYWSKISHQSPRKTVIDLIFKETNIPMALTSISQIQIGVLEYERKSYETVLLQELDSLRSLH